MKEVKRGPLTPYEIAAITAGVPCTNDEHLNAIITQGLRFKTAVELFKAEVINFGMSASISDALKNTDKLLEAFRNETP